MSMNETPDSERIHIGLFGRRNAGKSSVMNALTGQSLSIVSEVKGTTTDPVRKAMELLPLGPVVFMDTPGLDDEGVLGTARMEKSYQILDQTDIALVVIDAREGKREEDEQLLNRIRKKGIPYVVVYNKQDLVEHAGMEPMDVPKLLADYRAGKEIIFRVSARDQYHISELKTFLAGMKPDAPDIPIVADLVEKNDFVVLVVPIDKAAPKGRLILPQQQTIRELLDAGAIPVVTRETELKQTLEELGKTPVLVITDSQVFEAVAGMVPEAVPLTSFSILFARHKGVLQAAVRGAAMLGQLQDGDRILIAEGCTHHRQCGDIGTEKLPRWIQKQEAGKKLYFDFCSGMDFPRDLSAYRLVIQCGGCMLNEREVKNRYGLAERQGVAITNYGIVISRLKGILARSIAMLAVEEPDG
ncbi:MAG: [FeFe] hydrogenase H-cluster maturation GTPase HydF [Bacteroides sp.]|nr:[FeFe] hydrogenase H-cluster maturation GTPase HydF [Bacteroides sp.]MCM1548490.1 [FeFe] hydrogenase H-cluster maturation GTPase HydF [Clostridium sp.]